MGRGGGNGPGQKPHHKNASRKAAAVSGCSHRDVVVVIVDIAAVAVADVVVVVAVHLASAIW